MEESEIEESLITERMIRNSRIPSDCLPLLTNEIDKFNSKINKMKIKVGEELSVEIFFIHDGLVFSFTSFNDEIDLPDAEYFLNELLEDKEEAIDRVKEEKYTQREAKRQEALKKLEVDLLNNESFEKCTNAKLRRDFAIGFAYDQDENYIANNNIHSFTDLANVAEKVWKMLNYSKIK